MKIKNKTLKNLLTSLCAALLLILGAVRETRCAGNTYDLLEGNFSWSSWSTQVGCGSNDRASNSFPASATANYNDTSNPLAISSVTLHFLPTVWGAGDPRIYVNGIQVPFTYWQNCVVVLQSVDITRYYKPGKSNQVQYYRGEAGGMWTAIADMGGNVRTRIDVTYNKITAPLGFSSMTAPTITWASYGGATSYEIQIDTTALYNPPLITKTGLTGNSYTLTGAGAELLTNGITYYARIRAENGSDTTVQPPMDFTVDNTAPPAPALAYPPSGATVTTKNPKFDWSPVTSGTE